MESLFDLFVVALEFFDALLKIKPLLNITKTIGSTSIEIIKLCLKIDFNLVDMSFDALLAGLQLLIKIFFG